MPVYDSERECLVVRVVYDGSAFAGKTTNLQKVTELFPVDRRTEMYTPGALKGRTMFFDWLEVQAGHIGRIPLMCQLLTVPGQGQRSYRRKPLLMTADVVIFVCDSTPQALAETKKTYRQLRGQLRLRRPEEVPVIVQANKQDAIGAFEAQDIAAFLRLNEETPVLAASAASGQGVRDTLSLAIKTAARNAQALVSYYGIEAIAGAAQSAAELLDAMLEMEEREVEFIPDPSANEDDDALDAQADADRAQAEAEYAAHENPEGEATPPQETPSEMQEPVAEPAASEPASEPEPHE